MEESNAQDNQGSINKQSTSSSLPHVEINVDNFEADLGLKKSIYAYEDLMKPSQHIEVCFSTQSDQARVDYRTHLTASSSNIS